MAPYSVFVTGGSYLAVGVDSRGFINSQTRVRWNQVVEILHLWGSSIRIVEEGMFLTLASVRMPHHLAGVAYTRCITPRASESAQVRHLWGSTLIVEEGMRGTVGGI